MPYIKNMEQQAIIKPVILIIIDGFGYAPDWGGNVMSTARMPNYENYWRNYPHTILGASAESVGLPPRTRGNSESGHLNLGAGRVVRQDYGYISSLIKSEHFFENPALLGAINHANKNNSKLHLMGLLGDGAVHSYQTHLYALIELLKRKKFNRPVCLHLFTDGRDTETTEAMSFISKLKSNIDSMPNVNICTIAGRYYAMDRDNRWDRTSKAWQAIAEGKGQVASTPEIGISLSYRAGYTDEFLIPTVIVNEEQSIMTMADHDAVIFFNFRPDRARQLASAFVVPEFERMKINKKFTDLYFVTFVQYEDKLPTIPAFMPELPEYPLARVLSEHNLKQFHIAESEKYAHVTYFFNGGIEKKFKGEEREMIPSPKVSTYDQKPEMSAFEIVNSVIKRLKQYDDDFIVINFANADMVGHTGNFSAAITALETIDQCLGTVIENAWQKKGAVFITGDHGNSEEMINPNTGAADTEHTVNPVPGLYLVYNQGLIKPVRSSGILADVAPTILEIMQVPKPESMTGISLFDLKHFSPFSPKQESVVLETVE